MFRVSTVTASTGQVVSTDEAKDHLRIIHTEDDSKIDALIRVATEQVEVFTNRFLLTQTKKITYDSFSEDLIIPFGPVSSISHLKYYDEDGALTTLNASNYQYDILDIPILISRAPETYYWPNTQSAKQSSVEITFVAGYGNASAVPDVFKLAIMMTVAELYWNRTSVTETISSSSIRLPSTAELLVYPYKIWN